MSLSTCATPRRRRTDGPGLGHTCDRALNTDFAGRTSAAASGRALVPTTLTGSEKLLTAGERTSAAFLTQLIATAQQAPQTRARRRAPPGDASRIYAAADATTGFRESANSRHTSRLF